METAAEVNKLAVETVFASVTLRIAIEEAPRPVISPIVFFNAISFPTLSNL